MTTADFLAQATDQIELGYPDEAVARLMVLLDLAAEESAQLDRARGAMLAHPLYARLSQEPVMALAQGDDPDRINQLVSAICAAEGGWNAGHGSTALGRIMAASTLHRAIRARVRHADDMLARAWRDGRSIAVLGESFDVELAGLRGRDLSNLTITANTPARFSSLTAQLGPSAATLLQSPADFLAAARTSGARFDLIYLPRAAEAMGSARLAELFDQACKVLNPAGSIVAPAFLAGRVARGWQQAGLNWTVQSHTEAALEAACQLQNSRIRMIGDQTGCFVWLVASQVCPQPIKQGNDNGYE